MSGSFGFGKYLGVNVNDQVFIPSLRLHVLNSQNGYDQDDYRMNNHDSLYYKLENIIDTKFLELSPEIWLFRYKNSKGKKHNSSNVYVKKRWSHPSHQNGTKYENDKLLRTLFGGKQYFSQYTIFLPDNSSYTVPTTLLPGRDTEFPITSDVFKNNYTRINIKPEQWFSRWPKRTNPRLLFEPNITLEQLNDTSIIEAGDIPSNPSYSQLFDKPALRACGRKLGRKNDNDFIIRYTNQLFRFAIVINNPNFNGLNAPKLIGPMSDIVRLRIRSQQVDSFNNDPYCAAYRYYI